MCDSETFGLAGGGGCEFTAVVSWLSREDMEWVINWKWMKSK
jgi:hypothetical protein